MSFPGGVWEVQAWVTAPGDFPQPVLSTIRVNAANCAAAAGIAEHQLDASSADWPVAVSVRRIPLNAPNVEGDAVTDPDARQLTDLALKNAQTAAGTLDEMQAGPVYDALYALSEGLSQLAMAQLTLRDGADRG
jgi:hypothetical protein